MSLTTSTYRDYRDLIENEFALQKEEITRQWEELERAKAEFENYKAAELFKMLQTIPLYKEVKIPVKAD